MMKKRAKISMMAMTTHLMGGNACHVVALAKLDEPGTLFVIFSIFAQKRDVDESLRVTAAAVNRFRERSCEKTQLVRKLC